MNESSVSSPFMKQLRAELPGAIVLKHHDASMIGMGDCEIIWNRKVAWVEFKLIVPNRNQQIKDLAAIAMKSPTQHAWMCRMATQAHLTRYVFWVKKSKRIIVWNPLDNRVIAEFETTPMVVRYFAECLRAL